jgi:general secretion pathway protein G
MKTSALANRHHRRASKLGFTLMEMLIVLSIIALLMGMVIYSVAGFSDTGKFTAAKADVLALKEVLAMYQLDNGTLPTNDQGLSALWTKPSNEPVPPHWRPYLDEAKVDPWGHPYRYLNPGKHNPGTYDIYSCGPDGLPDTADDVGNWPDVKTSQ